MALCHLCHREFKRESLRALSLDSGEKIKVCRDCWNKEFESAVGIGLLENPYIKFKIKKGGKKENGKFEGKG